MLVCSHACIPQRNVVAYGIIHCRIWNFEDKAHQRRFRKVMRHDSFFETFIDNGSQCLERFQGAKDVIMQSRDTIYCVLSITPALFVLCIIWCFVALVYHTFCINIYCIVMWSMSLALILKKDFGSLWYDSFQNMERTKKQFGRGLFIIQLRWRLPQVEGTSFDISD